MDKRIAVYIIQKVLEFSKNFSDILFSPWHPVEILEEGTIKKVEVPGIKVLSPFQTETLSLALIDNRRRLLHDLISTGSCDLSYQVGKIRFRVNVFAEQTGYAIVMRKLPGKVPTIEELGLPSIFKEIAKEVSGIVLFAGPTGSGKSTSIAAILEEINKTKKVHIVTLEDPIEFAFTSFKATFNQRELGSHFNDFATALRAALRQAPHIIMVGEMRDAETVKVALSAAETGHLVVSTIHASYAGQAISRIVDMVGKEEESFTRVRLAGTLRWIICQKLIPKKDGRRLAIFEILRNNLRVQEAILQGAKPSVFYDILAKGSVYGMCTFDQQLISAYEKQLIDEKTALTYASFRSVVRKGIDQIKAKRGEATSDLEGLELDIEKEDSFHLL